VDELAIKVNNVSKDFVLPHEKINSVKGAFTGLHKRKDKTKEIQHALSGVSFEVKKGEFFGIVGRNGSGKSTLLKILAHIYQPTKGNVETYGKLVPFIELGVGFNPELTGRENVYLNGAMLGFSSKEIDDMYGEIVEFAELERFMDQKLKNYSSGMQVRLAFSMAIRAEADILLVDEVLAVGDADFQRKCFEYFKELKKNKKTVIFVSHDMNAVKEYCDRALLIENSKTVAEGDTPEITAMYTKLFTEEESAQRTKHAKRWGDQKIIQNKVNVFPKSVTVEDSHIVISVEFLAKEKAENPLIGFLIKRSDGLELMGTNTNLKQVATGDFEPGQKAKIEWVVPNVFEDGKFLIDVAISYSNGVTQYDWWEEAASFKVVREDRTPYIINPIIKVKLNKDED
jgi:ABC-2 type transport system ATP-binding protein